MSKSPGVRNTDKESDSLGGPSEYARWLTSSIARHEELAKNLVKHGPEKGRIVEAAVKTALRAILPARFSIGTGFAITASGQTSSQLDLVIYDNFWNAPILLEGGVGLFPIESIYCFVEVKSTLKSEDMQQSLKAIQTIRGFSKEKRYIRYGAATDEEGNSRSVGTQFANELSPRSFIFAVKSDFCILDKFIRHLANASATGQTHIHGIAILDKDWFISQQIYQDPVQFNTEEGHAFTRFCKSVLHGIQSFPMYPANMDAYLPE